MSDHLEVRVVSVPSMLTHVERLAAQDLANRLDAFELKHGPDARRELERRLEASAHLFVNGREDGDASP